MSPLPLKFRKKRIRRRSVLKRLIAGSAAIIGLFFLLESRYLKEKQEATLFPKNAQLNQALDVYLMPLEMEGGDPYIRALMRTISASEANVPQPYSILYGGDRFNDLSRHPEQCITIISGPNAGNCSTAAGRYQLLNTTWIEIAQRYHPQQSQFLFWKSYSFEPEFQDEVVYSWLNDAQVWGTDISTLLQQGKLNQVLRLLSGTWTSLGYGIEDNSITGRLPKVYQKVLQEELSQTG